MKTQSKKHKIIRTVLLVILLLLIVAAGGFISVYEGRFQTISSIQKVTDYDEYNLYRMDVKYDYDLDRLIEYGITDNQSFVDAIVKEALPILPVHIKAPDFGCSAFTLQEADGNVLMGRNYDFKRDTSAMLVYCEPKDGYKSVAFAALDNISANIPDASMKKKLATLTAPFICLDGMNEKDGIYCSPYFGQRTRSPEYRQTGDRNHACDPFDPGPRGNYRRSHRASEPV